MRQTPLPRIKWLAITQRINASSTWHAQNASSKGRHSTLLSIKEWQARAPSSCDACHGGMAGTDAGHGVMAGTPLIKSCHSTHQVVGNYSRTQERKRRGQRKEARKGGERKQASKEHLFSGIRHFGRAETGRASRGARVAFHRRRLHVRYFFLPGVAGLGLVPEGPCVL
jgi:hypothetical protein